MKKLLLSLLLLPVLALAQPATVQQNFQAPPNAAKPRVWWHWMNGNVTKDGIQKDLEWMSRVGIGGFQNFDASLFTPQVVPKKLVFMTPEWKDAFRFTTDLAQKLQLEMAIAGSPGWSVTGGPWVPPQDAMKKYVWTETRVTGGQGIFRKNYLSHSTLQASSSRHPCPKQACWAAPRANCLPTTRMPP